MSYILLYYQLSHSSMHIIILLTDLWSKIYSKNNRIRSDQSDWWNIFLSDQDVRRPSDENTKTLYDIENMQKKTQHSIKGRNG